MNRKGVFFIENKVSGRWLEELTAMGTVFSTDDTLKAMRFCSYGEALRFKVLNRVWGLSDMDGWTVTEHEFMGKE